MSVLSKYWYLILFAFLLSVGAVVSSLYLRKSEWMPAPVDPLAEAKKQSELAEMSDGYLEWNFEVVGVEEIRSELEKERERVAAERAALETLRVRIEQERAEMVSLREEIDSLREQVRKEFTQIEASEEANLKYLARIYTEMKPTPAIRLFQDMDKELVVKIMAMMPPENVASILEEMSEDERDERLIRQAAEITDKLRTLQK